MAIFNEEAQKQLKEMLKSVKEPIQVLLFTQEFECSSCRDTHMFLDEICALSEKLTLTVYDFVKDKAQADKYGVDKIPAILVLPDNRQANGICFYGPPGGYEINSFIKTLQEVSGNSEELPQVLLKRIKAIEKTIHIQVFITPSCPYCSGAVIAAHRIALENQNVSADMIEASTFPQLALKYRVTGVPKIVINETHELMGAQPLSAFLDTIENI
ncbi:thioredoxin family protein [bacterium]|nr:thioredoxin family protein [bacterium]MBU1634738.1 thioredoxin family protein [bacterium]MBU1875069.1 thioredoxin family protein [bacterium]